MKKIVSILLLLVVAMGVHAQGKVIFYESFDQCNGTGGNDGQWSGNIARGKLTFNNNGWDADRASGASCCMKLGTADALGWATTPTLKLVGNAVLSFEAGAWNSTSELTTLKLYVVDNDQVIISHIGDITLVKGRWSEYRVELNDFPTGARIKFSAAQKDYNRFFLDEVKVVAEEAVYERTGLKVGALGTLCLPNAVEADKVEGAEFMEISHKSADGSKIYFSEVTGDLVAGRPYIFVAKAEKIVAPYNGQAVDVAGNYNGLYGTFVDYPFKEDAVGGDIYVVMDDKIQMASEKSGVRANRAYIKMSEVPTQQRHEAKFVITENGFGLADEVPTGIETVEGTDNEAIFNLAGQRVNASAKGILIRNGRKYVRK